MKLHEARLLLNRAAHATPSLPNLGSRLAATVHRELIDGRANCKGSRYIINIFDRASPWILPRYVKSYANTELQDMTYTAIAWIVNHTAELHAMSVQVNAAITAMQPFRADIQP